MPVSSSAATSRATTAGWSGAPALGPAGPAVEHRSVAAAFQATAAAGGDAIALRTSDGGVELSWRAYATRVEAIARGLSALGVGPGATVGLLMANRPECYLVDTAALHLGATPFSIYATLPASEIAHLLDNAGCGVVLTEAAHVERVVDAARRAGVAVAGVGGGGGVGGALTIVTVDGEGTDTTRTLAEVEAGGDPGLDFEAA